ncbi:Calmodulin-like protein 8 [Linum grandiflorum]
MNTAGTPELTQDQIEEFRKAFCLIDKNGDGLITKEELAMVVQSTEIHDMISEVDLLGDGAMDFDEFLTVISRKMQEHVRDELKEAFKVFDRDQDGFISPTDLMQVMINMGERLTEEEAEQMIREADLDGDGRVSYHDFTNMMTVC